MAFAAMLSSSLIGFVLVIYPAFQVVFAYVILGCFLYYFLQALRKKKLKKDDWVIMGVTAVLTGGGITYSLWESWEAVLATLNTVYPGSRVSTGGDFSFGHVTNFLINVFLPFSTPEVSNQVEMSSSLNFLPFILVLTPFVIKKDKIRENGLGLLFLIYAFLLYLYSVISIPTIVAKVTLFSFVTGSRAWQAMSVIAVFASIWFLGYIWREKVYQSKKVLLGLMVTVSAVLSYFVVKDQEYLNYVPRSQMLLVLGLIIVALLLALYHYKKLCLILLFAGSLISGFTVNPIVQGISVIEDRKLATAIEEKVAADEEALWLVDSSLLYNYPQMFGAKTINGVRFYPDTSLMEILDPEGQLENEWNRYSHTRIVLSEAETAMSAQLSPDVLNITLNIEELTALKVTYVLSNRDLEQEFPEKFERVYGPDTDNNRIYRYLYSSGE